MRSLSSVFVLVQLAGLLHLPSAIPANAQTNNVPYGPQANVQVIVESGQTVDIDPALEPYEPENSPRTSGTINLYPGEPWVTPADAIVFSGSISYAARTNAPMKPASSVAGIWSYGPNGVVPRAVNGIPVADAPNGGSLGFGSELLAVDDADNLLLSAVVDDGANVINSLCIADPYDPPSGIPVVRFLMGVGDAAPGTAALLFRRTPSYTFTRGGKGVFQTETMDLINGDYTGDGIWQCDLATRDIELISLSEPTGSSPAYEDLRLLGIDDTGAALFLRTTTNGVDFLNPMYLEVRKGSPGSSLLLAAQGQDVPGVPGATFSEFKWASINASGRVSISAIIAGTGVDFLSNEVLLTGTGPGDLQLVYRSGQAPPGAGIFGTLRYINHHSINDAGQIYFAGVNSTSAGYVGYWLAEPSGPVYEIRRILVEEQDALADPSHIDPANPGATNGFRFVLGGGAYFGAGRVSFDDAGRLAIVAGLKAAPGGTNIVSQSSNLSVWRYDPADGLQFGIREAFPGVTTMGMAWLNGSPPRNSLWFDGSIVCALSPGIIRITPDPAVHPNPCQPMTVARWDFNEGTNTVPVPAGASGGEPAYDDTVPDVSGNGHALRTFSTGTAPVYSNVVRPGSDPSNRSLHFTPNQDLYRPSGVPFSLDGWTVEAIFNVDQLGSYQVIAGRDDRPVTSPISSLQLKVRGDNGRLQIEMLDAGGAGRSVQSLDPLTAGAWYGAAAVCDGLSLKLYLNSGDGHYVLQGQVTVNGAIYDSNGTWMAAAE